MGRVNKSGKTYKKMDKNTYAYYKQMYRANERYYQKKGWTDLIPEMMTKEEWEYQDALGQSNKDIIYTEFHKYSKESSEELLSMAKANNIKITKAELARGQFTQEMWDTIKGAYHALRDSGLSAEEAKSAISYNFWGSP